MGDMAEVFGGPTNQHRRSYWCLMRVVGCFCLHSGAVMATACGSYTTGEIALSWQLMAEAAAGVIYVGDRGFGIFSIVERARACGHDVILRLTESRARRLLGADSLKEEEILLQWKPSCRDTLAPEATREPIAGRLICVHLQKNGFRPETLWLFTTLTDQKTYPPAQLVEWYGLRWNVELDFRYLKTHLQLSQLEVKSSQMAYKEFYAGILCYNLVRLFMAEAALRAGVSAMKLSFSSCRRLLVQSFCDWIRERVVLKADRLRNHFETLLSELGKYRLPNRRKLRPNEPRKTCPMPRTFPPMSRSRQAERAALANLQCHI
jgi:putative transposase